ncbi:MAG TPA: RNA-binding cell elongation regulator Jag/EloR [Ktedonobacteraceae bacterium]|nr:RNA-binding cell elongation regulator Jag/EloR [Ktedonobacteraceae bacterium]
MESIEASGKSVDEAIAQALTRLGKRRDEVEVTVLQEPSRGAFGLGSKDALVRVTTRASSKPGAVITPEMADAILGPDGPEIPLPDDEEELYDEEEFEEDEEYEGEEEFEEEEPAPFISTMGIDEQQFVDQRTAGEVAVEEGEEPIFEAPSREDIEITVDVLQSILRYMNIHATVQVRSASPLTLNIHGINENLGLLIGRRGETLAALQLLVNLIVRHRTRRRIRIIVDAENYRERREENLRSLALRVAQQVRNYRRSIALEAMPPHERRIVHIALSDSQDISTESIGEGDERRVVISLKRPGR